MWILLCNLKMTLFSRLASKIQWRTATITFLLCSRKSSFPLRASTLEKSWPLHYPFTRCVVGLVWSKSNPGYAPALVTSIYLWPPPNKAFVLNIMHPHTKYENCQWLMKSIKQVHSFGLLVTQANHLLQLIVVGMGSSTQHKRHANVKSEIHVSFLDVSLKWLSVIYFSYPKIIFDPQHPNRFLHSIQRVCIRSTRKVHNSHLGIS